MNAAQWMTCANPGLMLHLLGPKSSDRKMHLFVADRVRALASFLGEQELELAEMHEQVVEGRATEYQLEHFRTSQILAPSQVGMRHWMGSGVRDFQPAWVVAMGLADDLDELGSLGKCDLAAEASRMCGVLRCIFGNPFQPVSLNPAWLGWNDGTLAKVADAIYHERAFDRMPILADALEEAGCDNAEILAYCRGPGPHVRGCWVVDVILAKQ